MPESFIPVWMSLGEATEFRRFLQEEARSTEGEFPEREFVLIDTALGGERPRSFAEMDAEQKAAAQPSSRDEEVRERAKDGIYSSWVQAKALLAGAANRDDRMRFTGLVEGYERSLAILAAQPETTEQNDG
jgi:hypothetical protein